MGLFGDVDLRLDPWQVSYGSELPLDAERQLAPDEVDVDVETPAAAWAPIVPGDEAALPARVLFVDGVRRLDARVLVRRAGRIVHGAFGVYAVGCVESSGSRALFLREEVTRILALDEATAPVLTVRPGLSYVRRSLAMSRETGLEASSDPDAPLRTLQEEMRQAEERLARELGGEADALVVTDGPLRFGEGSRPTERGAGKASPVVGFVKRLFELYVPRPLTSVLARLPRGGRSPLLALSSGRFARLAWFLRLADVLPFESDLSGLVRLEVAATVGVPEAVRLADATARRLPGFAPSRSRDPRAPQNLLPIGALESRLRHLLGDATLIRRHLEAFVAREAIGAALARPTEPVHA